MITPKDKPVKNYPWYLLFAGGLLVFSVGTAIGYTVGNTDDSTQIASVTENPLENNLENNEDESLKLGTFNPDQGEDIPTPTVVVTPVITPVVYGDENMSPAPSPRNCTLTIGFWKTHAGFGPQDDVLTPLLPIWLGTANGDKSVEVTTAEQAVLLLNKNDDASNGFNKLYAQLLGTKLNILSGSIKQAISTYLSEADTVLAQYDQNDWLGLDSDTQQYIISLAEQFDLYNNGDIGPGHCE
ncbi:MAG: hypothetical protein UV73_C0003G0034 [Candidatus Gottesmanbacteria bacterium GW2011_GWA2_43_14]|uniref:Uncharacterized protein n=1 Tax=Candidatus Gottesmanbacteria bacterium GW2011_GWA2_43_14 TaxID=1618443 RepID=A0A0G1DKL5_9BACT|nr:MAG: hypothetical protein UV73_C0003G0034 [Candidatus Gottesmanbacteria bacterium GW2011_GWA2_43_14]